MLRKILLRSGIVLVVLILLLASYVGVGAANYSSSMAKVCWR